MPPCGPQSLSTSARAWRGQFRYVLLAFGFAACAAGAALLYVSCERTIYTWDYATYWTKALSALAAIRSLFVAKERAIAQPQATSTAFPLGSETSEQVWIEVDPIDAIYRLVISVIQSIWFEDYSDLPLLPLLPLLLVIGAERAAYVAAIILVYVSFVVWSLYYALCALQTAKRAPAAAALLVPPLIVSAIPLFWAPILRGLLDVGAVALNLLAIAAYFRTPFENISLKRCVAVGIILASTVLFRRYNAFFLVSFIMLIAGEALAHGLAGGVPSRRSLIAAMAKPLVTAAAAGSVLALVAPPFLWRALTIDYADLYSAFRFHGSALEHLALMRATVGDATLFAVAMACAVTLRRKTSRRLACALIAQAIIIFLLFNRMQTFAFHHFYLFMPAALLLTSLALLEILARLRRRSAHLAVIGGLAVFALGQAWVVFAPKGKATPLWEHAAHLFPDPLYPPLVRHDLDAMAKLYAAVDQALEHMDGSAKFYVLSGSWTLNEGHFRPFAVRPPLVFRSAHRLLSSHVLDKTDGFPNRLLRAELVVSGTPPGGWQKASFVLHLPWEDLTAATGIGAAFEPIGTLTGFENGLEVTLFRRIRPNTDAEVAELSNRLRTIYPDRPEIFAPREDPTR